MEITKRVRVNLSTSGKGIVTPDVTIEYTGDIGQVDNLDVAVEADALMAFMRAKYPVEA